MGSKRRICVSIAAVIAAVCLGCTENDYQEVAVQPVAGMLTVKGKPAHGAYVVLHPSDSVGMTKGNKPFARVREDGSFTVTTYTSDDGAPVGDFVVTVTWPEDPEARGPSPDRLKGRFAMPESSGLEAHIDSETNELPPWDLQ